MMRTRAFKILITGLALMCVVLIRAHSVYAQGDVATEIDKLERQLALLQYQVESCDKDIQQIVVPDEDALDEVWESYKKDVDRVEKCVANLERTIDSLKRRLTELYKRLPNLAPGEKENPELKRMRERLLAAQKELDKQPPIIKELRARLDRLRAKKKK